MSNAADDVVADAAVVGNRFPTVHTRVPLPMLDAVDAAAALDGTTRSTAVRDLLMVALAQRGLWPPKRVDP